MASKVKLAVDDPDFVKQVSDTYVERFQNGTLSEIVYSEPYCFAYLYDVFQIDFYKKISNVSPSLRYSYKSRTGNDIQIYYEPYFNVDFIDLVYGRSFRQFLATLVGAKSATRPEGKYPQLRSILSEKGGMGIHDDNSATYNGVAFFNLGRTWQTGAGGELVIWKKLGGGKFEKCYEFAPRPNSMSVMRLCPDSFHSVNKPLGSWIRSNILVELDFS